VEKCQRKDDRAVMQLILSKGIVTFLAYISDLDARDGVGIKDD
jgi:hypothetical protein